MNVSSDTPTYRRTVLELSQQELDALVLDLRARREAPIIKWKELQAKRAAVEGAKASARLDKAATALDKKIEGLDKKLADIDKALRAYEVLLMEVT